MIFADKLINLRKKASLSQEELADKLGVSRQSVSKWEGAQSIPDINKIIEMSKIFGVSTDYLLKDEIEETEEIMPTDEEPQYKHKVSLEMASTFLSINENVRVLISIGVFLCIISPITLLILGQLSDLKIVGENLAGAVGITVLIGLVAVAVGLFITSGFRLKEYEFISKNSFETEYGVSGLVKEKKKEFTNTYNMMTLIGVILCVLSVLCVIVTCCIEDAKYAVYGVCGLLGICAVGVFLIVLVGCKMGAYNKLLQEGNYTKENKQHEGITGPIMGAYWLLATAVYLGWSLPTNAWRISWIVWVVAGVLCPVVSILANSFAKKKNN